VSDNLGMARVGWGADRRLLAPEHDKRTSRQKHGGLNSISFSVPIDERLAYNFSTRL
jgi:hypothetical protein